MTWRGKLGKLTPSAGSWEICGDFLLDKLSLPSNFPCAPVCCTVNPPNCSVYRSANKAAGKSKPLSSWFRMDHAKAKGIKPKMHFTAKGMMIITTMCIKICAILRVLNSCLWIGRLHKHETCFSCLKYSVNSRRECRWSLPLICHFTRFNVMQSDTSARH